MAFILIVAAIPILLGWDTPAEAVEPAEKFPHEYIAAMVIDRIAEGDEPSALRLYQEFFSINDDESWPVELLAVRRLIAIREIVQNPLWRTLGPMQLEFLKLHLKNGPLTPRMEREMIFLISRMGTLEAMAALYEYAGQGNQGKYLAADSTSLFTPTQNWRYTRFYRGKDLLRGGDFVTSGEIGQLILEWASSQHDGDPNPLLADVGGSTPESSRNVIRFIVRAIPFCEDMLSGVPLNKYRFFIKN